MAYAANCESLSAPQGTLPVTAESSPRKLTVLGVTVPSCDAFKVRRLLAGCTDASVPRCIP